MTIHTLITKSKFTVLLGKNGAGKSTLLRSLDISGSSNIKYISPERGGTLLYDSNVDNTISQNVSWLEDTRKNNRVEQFRQQSAAQFRNLEISVLREIEKDTEKRKNFDYSFDNILNQINQLLPAIKLNRSDKGFSIQSKDNQPISENVISSGESELIALAIEVLVFSRSIKKEKILLLDEPDVHLHPDLQQKFIQFIESVANERDLKIVIATHSTAIIGAFSKTADLQIVPITHKEQVEFYDFKRTRICEEILPVFGVHPLSTAFNLSPIVLVEGEDDKRVLEQVVRSSKGKLTFSPCAVDTINDLSEWEDWLNKFLPVLYDNPKAYSLRDLDDNLAADINDIGCVTRIRLHCYSIENLLLTDQCFLKNNFKPEEFKTELETWLQNYPSHKFSADIKELIEKFSNRRTLKIKNIRNILVALLGNNKPWEVLVGQLIAENVSQSNTGKDSIQTYLGTKAIQTLFS